jgi:hypothetical protein
MDIQAEEDKTRRVTLQVQVKHKRSELHSIDAALENLGKKKVTPQVKADISQWTAKRKTVAAEMESLKRKLAKIPVGANTKPAVDAMRNIPVPSVNIPVAATGVSGVNADIDHAARDRDTTIYVKARKVKGSGGTSPDFDVNGLAGGTSIVPQLFGADPATVAGLRAVSRQASTVAVGGTAQLSATTSGQRTVTHLAPKQVPVKIYLDGAEIADHLQLKAGRLATATTVRRRA